MTEKELNSLISEYITEKTHFDELKKSVEEKGIEVKSTMYALGLDEQVVDNWKVTRTVRKAYSFNEEQLLAILHAHNIEGVIKTKEYVDEDALESAIYNGKVSFGVIQAIAECRETKETVALTLKKLHGDK